MAAIHQHLQNMLCGQITTPGSEIFNRHPNSRCARFNSYKKKCMQDSGTVMGTPHRSCFGETPDLHLISTRNRNNLARICIACDTYWH